MGLGAGISLSFTEAAFERDTFTPASISNLGSWLVGNEGKTINTDSGTDYVSAWEDKVDGKIYVQNTLAYQPLNGSDHVDFRNLNALYRKDADWDTSSDGQAFEGIKNALVTHNTSGSAGHVFCYVIQIEEDRGGSSNGFYQLHNQQYFDDTTPGAPYGNNISGGGGVQVYLDGDFFYQSGATATATSFNAGTSAGTEMDYDTKLILTFRYEGGTNGYVKYYRDGTELTMTTGATGTLGQGLVNRLASTSNNAGFTGKMYEALVYSSDMSDANLTLLHNHLKEKYSIS
jgi:hypothetical protein|tara:strand:- start:3586 stop:4449 length:864 start_codon:yes stop_codon:yes gene_type:complete